MHNVIILCLLASAVQAQPIPRLQQPSLFKSPSAPLASPRLPPVKAGPERFVNWNPFNPSSKDGKKPRTPPLPGPVHTEEIITMFKESEDHQECEQAVFPWGHDNVDLVTQFGGYHGFRRGNCMLNGYPELYNTENHNIPFLGKITMRHFKKSAQLQFQSSVNPTELQTIPDAISIRIAALMGLVAFMGVAFATLRFCYHIPVGKLMSKEPQPMYEALSA